jgi:hypothetical protein
MPDGQADRTIGQSGGHTKQAGPRGPAAAPFSRRRGVTAGERVTDLKTRMCTLADGRAVITRRVHAPVQVVWSVLADGWLYATWVVGASGIRAVEPEWPARGSRLHHSFGVWPALIDDTTEVLTCDPGRTLLLKARGWPAGEAHVQIKVAGDGADRSIVSIGEDAIAGPGRLLPRPVRQLLIGPRNTETIGRLALIAEGRHRLTRLAATAPPRATDSHVTWK